MMSTGYRLDMTFMFAFHHALRRDLDHIARLAATPTGDPRALMGKAAGWQMFKTYLRAHHDCEDDTLWPIMKQTLAERPDDLALLGALEAEHAAIDPLFRAIDSTLANPASRPERLGELSDALASTLNAHLSHEEAEGLALVDAVLTEDQWQTFGRQHAQRIGPEAPRALPWILEGSDEPTTGTILHSLPEPLRAAYWSQWLNAYQQIDRWGTSEGRTRT